MKVLRDYPISVIYICAPSSSPTDAELLEKVRELIVESRQTGLVGHFISKMREASLPDAAAHYLGIMGQNVTVTVSEYVPTSAA